MIQVIVWFILLFIFITTTYKNVCNFFQDIIINISYLCNYDLSFLYFFRNLFFSLFFTVCEYSNVLWKPLFLQCIWNAEEYWKIHLHVLKFYIIGSKYFFHCYCNTKKLNCLHTPINMIVTYKYTTYYFWVIESSSLNIFARVNVCDDKSLNK